MIFSKLHISNFRNFAGKTLEFSPKTTVIVGPNASGKTNILESIFLLSTGKSFKARVEEEMIQYNEEIGRVKGLISGLETEQRLQGNDSRSQTLRLEVVLTRGEITVGETPDKIQKVARKRLLINGLGKRLVDFAGNFKTVLFGPWDMELITESPSIRRRFLDTVLSQVDREYRRAILSYEKGLRQRNKLLFRIREEPALVARARSLLLFWDSLLIKNGDYVSRSREEFADFINERDPISGHRFSVEYDKSAISESRLAQYKNEEIAAATTLVGPHRDDFVVKLKSQMSNVKTREIELARYGSRGEQRMSVLWLKLAELSYIESCGGQRPTLLLDDIFSELDHEHRAIVMDIAKDQQTIITTADPHYIEDMSKFEKIQLEE